MLPGEACFHPRTPLHPGIPGVSPQAAWGASGGEHCRWGRGELQRRRTSLPAQSVLHTMLCSPYPPSALFSPRPRAGSRAARSVPAGCEACSRSWERHETLDAAHISASLLLSSKGVAVPQDKVHFSPNYLFAETALHRACPSKGFPEPQMKIPAADTGSQSTYKQERIIFLVVFFNPGPPRPLQKLQCIFEVSS